MKSRSDFTIIAACMLFSIFWFAFYPPIYAIHDEAGYMAQAYVMRGGTIFGDVVGIQIPGSIKTESGHFVSRYAPGTSFLLIPFTFFGWRTIFLLPLVLHLIGFFVFVKILKIYDISPYFSLLYLLYPASVLYSRTIMSDVPSAIFFILAVYFFLKGKRLYLVAGLFFGILPLFRFPNIILAIPFFLSSIIETLKKGRGNPFFNSPFFKLLLGFLPGFFVFVLYNKVAFGLFFIAPYGVRGYFGLRFLPRNLFFYILSLSIIFPLMSFSIIFLRKDKFPLVTSTVLFLLFYALFKYKILAPGKSMLKTFVVGMRYILPIIPIFILSYVDLLEKIKRKIPTVVNIFFWFLIVIISILDTGMIYQHQKLLRQQERYKNIIYKNTNEHSLILINDNAMEFFQPVWGKRQYAIFVYWKKRLPVDFSKHNFSKLYLLTVIRSDKEDNEYVRKYVDEIVEEYSGKLVTEIKGDPELRLWRLNYENTIDSVSE